jgi:hypothetical protein
MDARREVIRVEFARFEQALRLARWQTISEALALEGGAELSSSERDEVDLSAATGCMPFDGDDDGGE